MSRENIDCLIIHVPNFESFKSYGVGFFMIMPIGILAMADYLQRNGYASRIIHLGLKKIKNPQFSLKDYIRSNKVKIAGISLHWAAQSFDVIETVKKIKLIKADIITVLGGFTASFFDQEIMSHFKDIDFIIRGDGEIPLLKLVQELSKPKPHLAGVPNLTWRDRDKIIRNDRRYVATTKDMDNLNFTNFGLLEESELYEHSGERQCVFSEKTINARKRFYLCIGRGCATDCSFCGGSKFAQKLVNNRNTPVFRSLDKVLEDIKNVKKANFDEIYIGFDPYPNHSYYIELFRLIRKAKIDISVTFECWSLPNIKFINEFKKTFRQDSRIMISPETASEELRHFHRGYSYSNQELFDILGYLNKKEVFSDIYFSYPLPCSKKEDIEATNNIKHQIEKKFGKYSEVLINELSLDPASKLYCYPDKYKIISNRNSFFDYYLKGKDGLSYLFAEYNKKEFKDLFLALQKQQNAREVLINTSYALYALGQYNEALALAKEAVEQDNKWGHSIIIQNYIRLKNFQEALDEIKQAQKKSKEIPFLSELKFLKAQALYALGQYNEVLALAKETSKLGFEIKGNKGNCFLIGSCLEKCERYPEAISELKKAEEINPEEAQINFSLFNCYRKIDQIELANKELEKGVLKFKRSQQKATLNRN